MEVGTPNIYELFLIFLHRLVNDTFDKGGLNIPAFESTQSGR